MRYYHLSKNCELVPQKYSEKGKLYGDTDRLKPSGFYFAKNDQWIKKENEFINDFNYKITEEDMSKIPEGYCLYRVFFKPETKFFCISSYSDFLNFNSQFKDSGEKNPKWLEIKEEYDGIIIENYWKILKQAKKELKFDDYIWFYTLDVDGGVIWNFEKVELFKIDNNLFNEFFHERKNSKKLKRIYWKR